MDEEGFRAFLKKKRKSEMTIQTCISNVRKFEEFLLKQKGRLEQITPRDVDIFAETSVDKKRVSKFMWTLSYYFEFIENEVLVKISQEIRAKFLKESRKPFKLKNFRGIKREYIEKLEAIGIQDSKQMLEAGRTKAQRKELAKKAGLHVDVILELVQLSDLSRLPGVKGIRTRLYLDSGFDSVERIAKTTPDELLRITRDFVEATNFDGIAPLPKEAESTVETAKKLPMIIEY